MERKWELIPEEHEDGRRTGRKLITRAGKAYGHIARSCRDAREEDLMLATAAPDLLAALERLTSTLDAISLSDEEAWTSDLIAARAAIAKAYEEVK